MYVPGYERIQKGSTITEKFYIGDYAVYAKTGTSATMRYLLQDNQGSITTILDQNGNPTENLAFDVWGKRRNANWTPATTALTSTTNRGYTGHKMLDNVGLIHMNGRVYDPVIARFVSADPIIQAPGDLQAYNRYAYVRNNPGSLVDPSGYSWLGNFWKKNKRGFFQNLFGPIGRNSQTIRNIQTVGVCIMTGPALCGTAVAANAYASGASTSQALRAGALSMVGAYVGQQTAGAVGGNYPAGSPQNVLGNGIGGGVQSRINGGSFQDGFVGGAVGAAFKPLGFSMFPGAEQMYQRMAFAGFVGGTASYFSGGSFGMGAFTGAFSQMWNGEQSVVGEKCGNCVAVKFKNGTIGWVPQNMAADVILADQSGASSVGAYVTTTRQEAANMAGMAALGTAGYKPVSFIFSSIAYILDSTTTNLVGVATHGLTRAGRVIDTDLFYGEKVFEGTAKNLGYMNDASGVLNSLTLPVQKQDN